jgi:protein-L-isoaspartate(D-aspartate) O-methyltransferase
MVTNSSGKWLTAAECAARTGLTVRALRIYERGGLLKPGRSANGWRRYGPDDLLRLNTIAVLKGLGLTLAQIRNLLRETEPSLLNILRVQAKSWRERQAAAGKALELVEAAIQRLERNQPPSLEELCQLVNALQARSTPMQNRATLMTDLMQELVTSDDQWQWQFWWGSHREDSTQNAHYLRDRAEGYAVLHDLQKQGVSPGDPAVQQELLKQDALIGQYGVRERIVRLMDWNPSVTAKIMELGTIARERHPDIKAMPFPLLSHDMATFIAAAINVSPSMQAVREVLTRVQSLIQSKIEPAATPSQTVVRDLEAVCAQHGLGEPGVYVRFMPFMARISHRTWPPGVAEAYEFLDQAMRAHGSPATTAESPAGIAAADDFTPGEVNVVRRAFARQLGVIAGIVVPRLEAAFAAVEREKYLAPGPWSVLGMLRGTFTTTPDVSPVHVYADTAVSIDKSKSLNNGQPSLYYRLLADALVPEGAHIVHVGAGTGYYSAVLGHLVGRTGTVTAIEYEAELAVRARANLQDMPQVEVIQGDATQTPFAPADLILVSAGATHPVDHWLDGLKDGGQLVLPLTPDTGMGIVMGIRRRGERWFATTLSPILIYRCVSARDPQSAAALAEALKHGGQNGVTRLYRGDPPSPESVWLRGENWCLAYG